ncbi:hypothetical protein B0H16DRAFT_695135 [Mycena metata]|uniref:Uncharacterized protein n=1 Tax=Mycena metata TaxID=1033252 RepID=A0AAD7J3W2_9AGAR|nr:hypothetical protein B0H16DRAFT_695135 [Mycena metata]
MCVKGTTFFGSLMIMGLAASRPHQPHRNPSFISWWFAPPPPFLCHNRSTYPNQIIACSPCSVSFASSSSSWLCTRASALADRGDVAKGLGLCTVGFTMLLHVYLAAVIHRLGNRPNLPGGISEWTEGSGAGCARLLPTRITGCWCSIF